MAIGIKIVMSTRKQSRISKFTIKLNYDVYLEVQQMKLWVIMDFDEYSVPIYLRWFYFSNLSTV